jgi:DNA mismatch endonuclease (patch repair protein)
MSKIRSGDTKPEVLVRQLLHRAGYRYRLHRKDLPGKPDLVFGSRRKLIFVHGCFWHQHGCLAGRKPRSNTGYWYAKLARNVDRDARNEAQLGAAGWSVLTVWECETKDEARLKERLRAFLDA